MGGGGNGGIFLESHLIEYIIRKKCEMYALSPSNFPSSCIARGICAWDGPSNTHVEDLETGNIQHTDEVLTLLLRVQSLVTLLHQPLEQAIEHTLAQGTDRVGDLVLVTALGDELVTDLDARLQQILVQVLDIDAHQLGDALTGLGAVGFGLLFAAALLECHTAHVHDGRGDLVDILLLFTGEAQDIESLLLCAMSGGRETLRSIKCWPASGGGWC